MSVGNLKDQGNKGNNFPYQIKNLQLLGQIANAPKAVNLIEISFQDSSITGLEGLINTYFTANPNLILVSKSVFYDTISAKYLAFLTMSTI